MPRSVHSKSTGEYKTKSSTGRARLSGRMRLTFLRVGCIGIRAANPWWQAMSDDSETARSMDHRKRLMSRSVQATPERAPNRPTGIPCPACGASVVGEDIGVPDHEYGLSYAARYMACNACGTLFQEPMPTVAQLASFCPPGYHSMAHAGLLNRIRNGIRIRRLAGLLDLLHDGCI
jgi:hypothetical protein